MITDRELQKGVKDAIKREIDAQKLYLSLYKKSETQNAKALFETLVTEEQKHEVILKTFLETGDIEEARKKVTIYQGDFNLARKIVDGSYDAIELRKGMKRAVKEERKAAKIYFEIYKRAFDKEKNLLYKEVFLTLGKEEKHHEALVIREYRKLFGIWDE